MPIICIGHSHIGAISKASAAANKNIIAFPLRELKRAESLSPQALQAQVGENLIAAVKAQGAKNVFTCCGGSLHAAMGLVQHPVRFDFVLPEFPELPFDQAADLIPFNAIRSTMATKLRRHWRLLRYLSETVPAKLVQFEPPPPVADEAFLKRVAGRFDSDVMTYGISSPHLRLKLWLLHNHLFREFCSKFNIDFMPNPAEIFDKDGFLAEPYWGDFVHANENYGAVILKQLEGYGA